MKANDITSPNTSWLTSENPQLHQRIPGADPGFPVGGGANEFNRELQRKYHGNIYCLNTFKEQAVQIISSNIVTRDIIKFWPTSSFAILLKTPHFTTKESLHKQKRTALETTLVKL